MRAQREQSCAVPKFKSFKTSQKCRHNNKNNKITMAPTNGTTEGNDAPNLWYSISDVIEIWTELVVFHAIDDSAARSSQLIINDYEFLCSLVDEIVFEP